MAPRCWTASKRWQTDAMTPGAAKQYYGVLRVLSGILNTLIVVLSGAVVTIVLAQVFSRYVLGSSLIWSGELMRLLHFWMIMLAAVQARHMRITLLSDMLPLRVRRVLEWGALAVAAGCLGLLVWGGWRISVLLWNDTYTRLPVSPALLFVAVCIGGTLWFAVAAGQTVIGYAADASRDTDDAIGTTLTDPKSPPVP